MNFAKVSIKVVVVVLGLVMFACQVAEAKTASIDFWFVKKGSVSVPAGMKMVAGNPDNDQGSYPNTGRSRICSLSKKFSGVVAIGAINCNSSADVAQEVGSLKPTLEHAGILGPIIKSSVKIAKTGGGSYKAIKWSCKLYPCSPDDGFKDGDRLFETYVCVGSKIKYMKGMRYEGLDTFPVYWITVERDKNSAKQASDMASIIKSLKLP